jgi:hypothetical protein
MKETNIDEEQVRKEHLREVNQPAHWIYLLGVMLISFFLMIGLILVLGQ